jgi:hypothetical protein
MRKTTSRIARLPETVRTEINQKLDEGWPYKMIREWLFGQTAGQDIPALELKAGDSYAVVWARGTKTPEHAADACEQALSNWYGKQFPGWVKERKELEKDKAVRLVERVDEIGRAVGEKVADGTSGGANLVIRSLLFEAMSNARQGQSDPKEIARLAQAWARVSDAGVEVEKMNLKTKEAVDVGLEALYEDVKQWPEAVEAWQNFYDVVKRLEAGGKGQPTVGNS